MIFDSQHEFTLLYYSVSGLLDETNPQLSFFFNAFLYLFCKKLYNAIIISLENYLPLSLHLSLVSYLINSDSHHVRSNLASIQRSNSRKLSNWVARRFSRILCTSSSGSMSFAQPKSLTTIFRAMRSSRSIRMASRSLPKMLYD